MITKNVVPSGAVGKQVYTSAESKVLKGFLLYSPSGLCSVQIRDGYSSGNVELRANSPSGQSVPVLLPSEGRKFTKGMHVEVIGTAAECYLYID